MRTMVTTPKITATFVASIRAHSSMPTDSPGHGGTARPIAGSDPFDNVDNNPAAHSLCNSNMCLVGQKSRTELKLEQTYYIACSFLLYYYFVNYYEVHCTCSQEEVVGNQDCNEEDSAHFPSPRKAADLRNVI